jgi:RND superfamily putative drug exporter
MTEFVLRHRLLVALFWLAITVVGILTIQTTTGRLSQTFSLPNSPAASTEDLLAREYHSSGGDPTILVFSLPEGQTVDSPGVRESLVQASAAETQLGGRVVDFPSTNDRAFVTKDGRTVYTFVFSAQSTAPTMTPAVPPGWHVAVTGTGPLSQAPTDKSGNGLLVETIIGAVGALAVLVFVYASFVAVIPLLMAAVSILSTFLLVLGMTEFLDVNIIASFVIGLIGLGVAIDYSLLIVTRWREERAHGSGNRDAVRTAMAHAGRAVMFSGVTVTVGLLTLVVLPIPALRSIGYAGALIPLVSVAVASTLLPVVLDAAGPILDRPRLRLRHERRASRTWTRWAQLAVRRRWIVAAVGVAALALLALPATQLQLGSPRSSSMAQTGEARTALTMLTDGGVPGGVLTPITVVTTADQAPAVAARIRTIPGVDAVFAPTGTTLVTVLPADEAMSPTGTATVARVRADLAGVPGVVGVTSSGAGNADFEHAVYGGLPWMLLIVSIATFLLLARAFRSLVLAAKAVVLNLVSLGAAYGILVLIWQQGHGSEAVWGTPATGAIATWIPLMVFAFLFGLSMDYEVFLLARMREAYDEGLDTNAAVVVGIGRTGRLVSAAALILFLSFLSMSTAPSSDVRVMATGLGAGILVDATIVRCLLVPALVSLMGRANWWMPGWAARLLRVPAPAAA